MIHTFRVRPYQAAFHKALVNREYDRLLAVWHRRAGKDEIVLDAFRNLAHKEIGTYWHCFPEQKQARKALWNGVDSATGKRRILQAFPEQIINRMVDNDMFIEFKNGSTYQMIGSDRYDATVGSGPKGIAYSEWALSNPQAWAYHSPMIRESKGWAAFITTPRGNNHARRMAIRAAASPNWFYELLSIDDTRQLSEEVLAEALEEYIDLHGIDAGTALYEQEYQCSWSGSTIGSIWGAEMILMEKSGRFKHFEIDEEHPVHTSWDLGKAKNNPVICFQVIGGQPRIVDCYVPEKDDLNTWVKWLKDKAYTGNWYVPHDILVTEWGTDRTRLSILREARGDNKVKRIPMVSVGEGWQAGRSTINEALFYRGNDERGQRVQHLVDGLKEYRLPWDAELRRLGEHPVKDWSEHLGSAFRYLGLCWRDIKPAEVKPQKPTELEYAVKDGRVVGNMSVKQIVEMKMKKRRLNG